MDNLSIGLYTVVKDSAFRTEVHLSLWVGREGRCAVGVEEESET